MYEHIRQFGGDGCGDAGWVSSDSDRKLGVTFLHRSGWNHGCGGGDGLRRFGSAARARRTETRFCDSAGTGEGVMKNSIKK